MSFHDRATNIADRLIDKYGDDITIIKRSSPTYDTNTGKNTWTEERFDTVGSVTMFSQTDPISNNVNIDNLMVMVSEPYTIDKTWAVEYKGKVWQILAVTRVSTQNYIITQKLQIRA